MDEFKDDFGDLYADVEVQARSATIGILGFAKSYVEPMGEGEEEEEEEAGENDGVTNKPGRIQGFCSDSNKFDPMHEDSGWTVMNRSNVSDSEDDLNIVLNDEDCENFPGGNPRNGGVVLAGGNGEDEDDEFLGDGSGGLEPSSNGQGGERGNAVRGWYTSQYQQYKYMRSHGATFPSSIKGNGSIGMSSYFPNLGRVDWADSLCNQRKGSNTCQVAHARGSANSVAAQYGYGFSLPRYRTILDVNIDAFEEKPWRFPGVDITDFFNFGFNEDTWKQYCSSLEQFHRKVPQSGFPINECSKMNQAYEAKCENPNAFWDDAEESYKVGSQRTISPSSKLAESKVRQFGMPKGRAIQVEDSAGERQPSMDVRRSRTRDCDVIQIAVQDPADNSFVSGEEEVHVDNAVHEALQNGDFEADDCRDIHCTDNSSGDELSVESLEGNTRILDWYSVLKRCSQETTAYNPMNLDSDNDKNEKILDMNGNPNQKEKIYPSEELTEEREVVNKIQGGVGRNFCSADPCMSGTELSPDGHCQLSLDSPCYGSDSEASRDSVYADTEKTPSALRSSLSCSPKLPNSVSSFHKDTKSSSVKSTSGDVNLFNKGSTQEEKGHCSRRGTSIAKSKIQTEDNEDAAPILEADLHKSDRSSVKCRARRERKQGFECIEREDRLYDRGKKLSRHNGGENFAENGVQTVDRRHLYRRDNHSLRDEIDMYVRKNWDEREYIHEQRSHRVSDAERNRKWYHRGRFSSDYLGHFTGGEGRELNSRYSLRSVEERDAQWRRKHGETRLRKRANHDGCWVDYNHEDNFVLERYERPASFADRDSLDEKYGRELPYKGRELKNSGRRGIYADSPPAGLDYTWSGEIEDEYWRHMDYRSLGSRFYGESYTAGGCHHETMSPGNDVDNLRLIERYGRRRRQIFAGEARDSGLLTGYNNADDSEDCTIYLDDQGHLGLRRYGLRSRVLRWTEDELVLRHRDHKFCAEDASFENTPTQKRIHERYKSAHDGRLNDEMQVQRHSLNTIREGSGINRVSRSCKIVSGDKHEHAVLRCRNSVNLVVGEGKSPGRCSKGGSLMSNGRCKKIDHKIDKKQTVLMDYNEPYLEKAVQPDIPKIESSQSNAKWLDKFPITEHNEDLDIEEGQIVTEEPNTDASFRGRDVPEDGALTLSVKKRIIHNGNSSNGKKVVGVYDNQRILETLAKMEKRRERFKEPITLKKEPGKIPKPQVDLTVDTDEANQKRPARKRRWDGN